MKKLIEYKLQRETIYIEMSLLDKVEECTEYVSTPFQTAEQSLKTEQTLVLLRKK